MTYPEFQRLLSYLIQTAEYRPTLSPEEILEIATSLAPIEKDSEDYRLLYREFLVWHFTKRNRATQDLSSRAKAIIGMWTRLSRISSKESDAKGWIAIDGVTYDFAILRSVIYDLIYDGLIKTVDR